MSTVRVGPARLPSRESPEEAVRLLIERGYSACELDFESGFWMDKEFAARLGQVAAGAGLVLSVHAPIAEPIRCDEHDRRRGRTGRDEVPS